MPALRGAVADRRTVRSVRRPTRGLAPEATAACAGTDLAGEAVQPPRGDATASLQADPSQDPGAGVVSQSEATSFTPTTELGAAASVHRPIQSKQSAAVLVTLGVVVLTLVGALTTAVALLISDRDLPSRPAGQAEAAVAAPTGAPTVEPDAPGSKVAGDSPSRDSTVGRRSVGPLGLSRSFANQPCSNQWLVILASSGDPEAYVPTLAPALRAVPDSRYLVTDRSCRSFVQSDGRDRIYAAYQGPYTSFDAACAARSKSGYGDSYIRQLSASITSRSLCSCLESAASPLLSSRTAYNPATPATLFSVTDVQVLLDRAGFNPESAIGGYYREQTTAMVSAFQRSEGLRITGATDLGTWQALRTHCDS